MKIYEIGTGYTPIPAQHAAATESVVEELTKAFSAAGQDVEILDISACERAPHDLPITEVKVPSAFTKSDVSLGVIHKVKRVVYSAALALKLRKLLKAESEGAAVEKKVLHFHNQYNLFFFIKLVPEKLRNKITVAYTNHNGMWSLPLSETKTVLRKRYFQEIEAMKKADAVFVLNNKTRDNISELLGISDEKIYLVSNGVNTGIYTPLPKKRINEIKEKYGLSDKKIILQVGSVYENKGQAKAVKLLAPLLKGNPKLVYAYAGGIVSSEYFLQVKKTAEELGVASQVVYLGTASPGKDMNELYNIAYMTVFASKYEGFPLVCIESLSAGVPVTVCSDGGMSFDFGAGSFSCTGISFEQTVSEILTADKDSYSELCKEARENAEMNHRWDAIAKKYTDILTGI